MFFHHHPPHVRKTIALVLTAVVGIGLLVLLAFIYLHKPVEGSGSGSKIVKFYTTILQNGQSYFSGK